MTADILADPCERCPIRGVTGQACRDCRRRQRPSPAPSNANQLPGLINCPTSQAERRQRLLEHDGLRFTIPTFLGRASMDDPLPGDTPDRCCEG